MIPFRLKMIYISATINVVDYAAQNLPLINSNKEYKKKLRNSIPFKFMNEY